MRAVRRARERWRGRERRERQLSRAQRFTIAGAFATALGAGLTTGDPAAIVQFIAWLLQFLGAGAG